MKTVIVDIDGTIADLTHRRHFLPEHGYGKPADWDNFFEAMSEDTPIWPVVDLVKELYDHVLYTMVFVTGRPEQYRNMTLRWLIEEAGLMNVVQTDMLYMRKEKDTRPDYVVKKEILDQLIAEGHDIAFTIDDRSSVVSMWRENGLICLQAAAGDFDKPKYESGMLTVMVGPSGAGKSTWLENTQFLNTNAIVSSDEIRKKLCGNIQDQSKNAQVFNALHAIVKAHIENGLNVIVDATNLRNRDRRALRDLCLPDTEINYIVLNRSIEEKTATGGWRNDVPLKDGKTLIERHEDIFKSNLKDILAGDNDSRVTVLDYRDFK